MQGLTNWYVCVGLGVSKVGNERVSAKQRGWVIHSEGLIKKSEGATGSERKKATNRNSCGKWQLFPSHEVALPGKRNEVGQEEGGKGRKGTRGMRRRSVRYYGGEATGREGWSDGVGATHDALATPKAPVQNTVAHPEKSLQHWPHASGCGHLGSDGRSY